MSLLSNLKNYTFKKRGTKTPNEKLTHLNTTNLKAIVAQGLSELYKIQPSNPITFLSNWLRNEADSSEILNQIAYNNELKLELEQKYIEQEKLVQEQIMKQQEEEQKRIQEKEELNSMITGCTDFEDHLNEICEKFKKIIGATGVYIMKYDLKRKYPIDPDADENGHIDPERSEVLQFIHWCDDHSFLHRQILEKGSGVTYKLVSTRMRARGYRSRSRYPNLQRSA